MHGNPGGGGGHIVFAHAAGHVDPVEEDTIAFPFGLQNDARVRGHGNQRFFLVEPQVAVDGLQGERAIHGSGLQVQETEAAGEMGGQRALAGAGGSVNGDDGLRAQRRG